MKRKCLIIYVFAIRCAFCCQLVNARRGGSGRLGCVLGKLACRKLVGVHFKACRQKDNQITIELDAISQEVVAELLFRGGCGARQWPDTLGYRPLERSSTGGKQLPGMSTRRKILA